jgi:hypothetical protein
MTTEMMLWKYQKQLGNYIKYLKNLEIENKKS